MKHLVLLLPLVLAAGPAAAPHGTPPAGPPPSTPPVAGGPPASTPPEGAPRIDGAQDAAPPSGTPPEGGPPVSLTAVVHLPHAVHHLVEAGVPEADVGTILDAAQAGGMGAGAAAIVINETSIQVKDKGFVPNVGAFVAKQIAAGLRGKALVQAIANFHAARGESWDDKPPMGHPDAGRDHSVVPERELPPRPDTRPDRGGAGKPGPERADGGKKAPNEGPAKGGAKPGGTKSGGTNTNDGGSREGGTKGTNRRWGHE